MNPNLFYVISEDLMEMLTFTIKVKMAWDEKDWFLLFNLAKLGAINRPITKTTSEIAVSVGSTQQTISRRLKILEEKGLISRKVAPKSVTVRITEKGLVALERVYAELRNMFDNADFPGYYFGRICTGMGEGRYYVKIPNYYRKFTEFLGAEPYPGTLNLILFDPYIKPFYSELRNRQYKLIGEFSTPERTFGAVKCYYVYVFRDNDSDNKVLGLYLNIKRTAHKRGTIEIVAAVNLREYFGVEDNSVMGLCFAESNPLPNEKEEG